jgi:hypothetical protein
MAPLERTERFLGRAREQERGGEVDIEDAVPVVEAQSTQRLEQHDAGVGHEAVESSECLGDGFDGASGGVLFGDAAFDQKNIPGSPGKCARQACLRQIERGDRPARPEQVARDGAADPVGRAGHQRHGTRARHRSILGDRQVVSRAPFGP